MQLGRRRLLAAGAAGGALVALAATPPARADQALDVQLLQTAASIENVAMSAYETILALPLFGPTTPHTTLKEILTAARNHHADHAKAYNEATGKLGGRAQTAGNPNLSQIVGRSRLTDVGAVVDLALQLEAVAAQTYQNNVGSLADLNARKLSASILAVESQHAAALRVVKAIAAANLADLINVDSGAVGRLPPDAARVGTPDAFSKTDDARPPAEGAVR